MSEPKPKDKTCWWCKKEVDTSKEHVYLKDPLSPDQPLMHKPCYWDSQEIFY